MSQRFTKTDVARKVELIANMLPSKTFSIQTTAPGDGYTRYEMPWGYLALGAREACALLDAYREGLLSLALTEAERAYVARAIDVARSDSEACQYLSPAQRDELLNKFGGRKE